MSELIGQISMLYYREYQSYEIAQGAGFAQSGGGYAFLCKITNIHTSCINPSWTQNKRTLLEKQLIKY